MLDINITSKTTLLGANYSCKLLNIFQSDTLLAIAFKVFL